MLKNSRFGVIQRKNAVNAQNYKMAWFSWKRRFSARKKQSNNESFKSELPREILPKALRAHRE